MKDYLKEVFPADFKNNPAFWRAFVLGLVMLTLAVTQLFQFEDFPEVMQTMQIPGGMVVAWLLAVMIPLLEVGSLPYLFSMKLTKKMRNVSKWTTMHK